MKKAFLLIALIVAVSVIHAQFLIIDSVRIDLSKIVATDTIIPFNVEQVGGECSICYDYTTLDADDATIDIMVANQRSAWVALTQTGWPYTLNVTTNTDALTNTATVCKYFSSLPFPFVAIRLKKGSVTSGYINAKRIIIAPVKRNQVFP